MAGNVATRYFMNEDPFLAADKPFVVTYRPGMGRIYLKDGTLKDERPGAAGQRIFDHVLAAAHTGKWAEVSREDAEQSFSSPQSFERDMPATGGEDSW
jgi:hypothetical protein